MSKSYPNPSSNLPTPPQSRYLCSTITSWIINIFSRSSTTPTGDTHNPCTCPACPFGKTTARPLAMSTAAFPTLRRETFVRLMVFVCERFRQVSSRSHVDRHPCARYMPQVIDSRKFVFVPEERLHAPRLHIGCRQRLPQPTQYLPPPPPHTNPCDRTVQDDQGYRRGDTSLLGLSHSHE